jgi:hypothetical protein
MIELSEEQRGNLVEPEPAAVDPQTQQIHILARKGWRS